jgi:hypothetical protein
MAQMASSAKTRACQKHISILDFMHGPAQAPLLPLFFSFQFLGKSQPKLSIDYFKRQDK